VKRAGEADGVSGGNSAGPFLLRRRASWWWYRALDFAASTKFGVLWGLEVHLGVWACSGGWELRPRREGTAVLGLLCVIPKNFRVFSSVKVGVVLCSLFNINPFFKKNYSYTYLSLSPGKSDLLGLRCQTNKLNNLLCYPSLTSAHQTSHGIGRVSYLSQSLSSPSSKLWTHPVLPEVRCRGLWEDENDTFFRKGEWHF
jgi:hypothetical protein